MHKVMGNLRAIILFLLPAIAVFTFALPYPILKSFYYSFFDWKGVEQLGTNNFVFLGNYIRLFNDDTFLIALKNTLIIAVFSIGIQLVVSMVLAVFVATTKHMRRFYQTAYYFPNILSNIIVGCLWWFIFSPEGGLLNSLMKAIGVQSVDWLGKDLVLYSIIFVFSWQWIGYYMVIYMTAIFNIPHDIIEAARIDGVKGMGMVRRIFIPIIWPVIKVTIVIMMINSLKIFEIVLQMTKGGPDLASETLGTYMWYLIDKNNGYASAMSTVLFIVTVVISIAMNKILRTKNIET